MILMVKGLHLDRTVVPYLVICQLCLERVGNPSCCQFLMVLLL
jgi:hypothetical protein